MKYEVLVWGERWDSQQVAWMADEMADETAAPMVETVVGDLVDW